MTVSTEIVWERFSSRLLGFIRNRVADPHEADDLLQEVFLKIHTRADTLQDEERLTGWVFQIARNTIIDHYRARVPWVELDDAILNIPQEESDFPAADPEARLAAGLGEMLECIPEKYRLAVRMSELEGLRQDEVATRLGLSLSGAKSRVQRGRALLKQALLDCCHFEFDRRGRVMGYTSRCCHTCSDS